MLTHLDNTSSHISMQLEALKSGIKEEKTQTLEQVEYKLQTRLGTLAII